MRKYARCVVVLATAGSLLVAFPGVLAVTAGQPATKALLEQVYLYKIEYFDSHPESFANVQPSLVTYASQVAVSRVDRAHGVVNSWAIGMRFGVTVQDKGFSPFVYACGPFLENTTWDSWYVAYRERVRITYLPDNIVVFDNNRGDVYIAPDEFGRQPQHFLTGPRSVYDTAGGYCG